ncbi:MAG: hypothetical protein R3C56_14380 [Pirellulaceae bacterium]
MLICLANQTGVDHEQALRNNLQRRPNAMPLGITTTPN